MNLVRKWKIDNKCFVRIFFIYFVYNFFLFNYKRLLVKKIKKRCERAAEIYFAANTEISILNYIRLGPLSLYIFSFDKHLSLKC